MGSSGGRAAADDLAVFSKPGLLTTGAVAGRFPFPFAAVLLGVTAATDTAPNGAAIIVDVNKNGSTIFTNQANRPTIPAGTQITATEATPDVADVADVAAGDYLTVAIDQIGSIVPGSQLSVVVRYQA